jgi:hypothetical protein
MRLQGRMKQPFGPKPERRNRDCGNHAGFEPEDKRFSDHGRPNAQWNQYEDLWLPVVGNYRTFLNRLDIDHAEFFAVAATL